MICFPNAKINLGLNIVSKRPDGYHNLETIFYPIPIEDALEAVPSNKFSFEQQGITVNEPIENNLVIKALRLLEKDFEIPPISVHLLKKIPFGAGLGGGSSDAAFMLKLLNDLFELHLTPEELEKKAAILGADCAFFIKNKPVFATGIGNIFEPINLSLKGYYLCLIKPDIHISTAEAYALIKPQQTKIKLTDIILQPIEEWKNLMVNDFEKSVFAQQPTLKKIKEELYTQGAIYAAMSGSGSSLFGLFKQPTNLSQTFKEYYIYETLLK